MLPAFSLGKNYQGTTETMTQVLSKTTRRLHWITGLLMLGLMLLGFYMTTFEDYDVYPLHKAVGVLALFILIPRAVYRVSRGLPTAVANQSETMNKAAHYAHWMLLAGTILMPITGMFYSGFGGYGINIFGFILVADTYTETGPIPINETLYQTGKFLHTVVGYALAALIVGHIGAAIKHHVVDKDPTLTRMLGVNKK